MSKLTEEDIARLERAISAAVRPVAPPPGFVESTRQAVLSAARAPQAAPRGYVWRPGTYMAVVAALLAFAAAVAWRVLRTRARSR